MERRFSIEAKSFCFSIKEGFSDLRLEERRKKFVGFIFASFPCATWLRDTVEAATQVKEDISKSYREGDKVLMVHGGSNKAGRYLEVSVYTEGGRKGVLWIPEGRFGRGWRRFAGELRLMLVSPNDKSDSGAAGFSRATSSQISPAMYEGVGGHAGCSKARSFVEVLQSKPCLESSRGEAEKGGDVKRPAVEEVRPAMEAVSARKTNGCSLQGWVSRLLGYFQIGLGRVWAGLLEGLVNGPKDWSIAKRLRAVLKGFKACGLRKFGLGFTLKPKRWTRPVRRKRSPEFKHPSPLPALEVQFGVAEAETLGPVQSAAVGSAPVSASVLQLGPVVHPTVELAGSPLMVAYSQPEWEVGKSPPSRLGETSPLPMLSACEVCVGVMTVKSDGSGAEVVTSSSSPVSGVDAVPSSDFGLPVDVIVQTVSTTLVASASPAITPSTPVPAVSVAGSEPLGFEDPGDSSVQGIGSVPDSVEPAGEKTLALVTPPVEQDPGMADGHPLPAEESDLALTVVSPPDAGDGSFQMSGPGFSVPSAEEFLEFLPAGSMSKDWQDSFSSSHTDRRGLSDSELIKEAFALPWEVDELASPSCRDKEDSSSGHSFPVKGMLRRGFLGSKIDPSPALSPALASSSTSEVIAAPAMVSVGSKESEDGHVDLDPDPDPEKCAVGLSPLDFCTFDTAIDTTSVELTDTQRGLIERMRKELKVNDTTKVVLKHIEEIFLRVNKGVRDGVLPAEEGESLLAFHFEQIEKFLSGILDEQPRIKGKRERRNLESSINYGIAPGPSRTRKGKVTVM
jgi:hypothetical protein